MLKSKEFVAYVDHLMSKSDIMDATSSVFVVVNSDVNVVYSNKNIFDLKVFQPGDLLGCSNALNQGCGKSPNCPKCEFRKTVEQAFSKQVRIKRDVLLSLSDNSMLAMKQMAIPFEFDGVKYVAVFIVDITASKYKDLLEKTFSHSLLDMEGALDQYLTFMVEGDGVDKEMLEEAKKISFSLLEHVRLFRDISMAQQGNLAVNMSNMAVDAFLRNMMKKVSLNVPEAFKRIDFQLLGKDVMMKTDINLLTRIVRGMLRNALENEKSDKKVTLSAFSLGNEVEFRVHNDSVIDKNVDGHIFKVGVTTHGQDHGLGTFSMKLLGENYLGGKVWFESSEEKGTSFHIKIPID